MTIGGSLTGLVSSITQPGCNCGYGYDDNGNIASATINGKWTGYTYDALGQLVQVNDRSDTRSGENGTTWKYTYDLGGNILQKQRFAYKDTTTPLETVTYEYGDANWRDKLTAVNGTPITYDAIGNPLNDGTWTYTWQNGRQLARMQSANVDAKFVYNESGLRVQKIVNGVVTDYVLHGKNVVHMTKGNDELHFFYDAQNRPAVVVYNNVPYAYVKNLQGDVIAILDEAGNVVVGYAYDAWGQPISKNGALAETLGKVQPFRYRGYVFDEETGLYYLRSRYYNAERCRFVNADTYIQQAKHICGFSVYAYASNSPVVREDASGNKDYIYTSQNEYYIENDMGSWEWLNPDCYYVEIDGVRCRCNSQETAILTDWSSIDFDFTTSTLDDLIGKAEQKNYSLQRVWDESIGGELDFKLQMSKDKLYYDSANQVLYNRNEAGNYVWAYYLTLHGGDYLQGILAQGGSIVGSKRLDESWDWQARWNGVEAARRKVRKLWNFHIIM